MADAIRLRSVIIADVCTAVSDCLNSRKVSPVRLRSEDVCVDGCPSLPIGTIGKYMVESIKSQKSFCKHICRKSIYSYKGISPIVLTNRITYSTMPLLDYRSMKDMISKRLTTVLATATLSGALLLIPTLAHAWSTDQSAQALCLANSTGAIRFSFTNKETNNSPMNVSVKDSQTGATFNLGTINDQQTKTGEIDTGKSNLSNGTITFYLTWTNKSGSDSRTANYSAITCVAPTATPTPRPSATPTPTSTPMPSATPTPTETPVPSATPTPTVAVTVTPTPTSTNTNNCDDSTQTGNNNANNNCNNNNNTNNNSNSQSQDQTQNNNQNVNVTVNNNNNTQTVLAASTTPTQLPSTGADATVWMSLFGLIPAGFGIRKFASKK